RDHVFGITAIEINPRDFPIVAHGKISAPASITDQIVSAVPSDTHTVAFFPLSNIGADSIDAAGDFMSRHSRVLKPRPETLFNQSVAMTNAARLHFYTNLTRVRLWNIPFYQYPISTGFPDLRRVHSLIHKYLVLVWLLNRFVWQEAGRDLFHRADNVCGNCY